MKTILAKVLGAFLAVFLLTSCLGDKDSYIENKEGEFVYFKYDDSSGSISDKLYAWIPSLGSFVPAPASLSSITPKRAYYAKYKINLVSGNADYLDLIDNDPVPTAEFRWDVPYSGFQPALRGDSIHPLNISVVSGYPAQIAMDDNWLIKYNVPLKENDKVEAQFYYDPNSQYESGMALDKNQVIIDVRFVKVEKDTEAGKAETKTLYALGSLSQLRSSFPVSYPADSDEAYVDIKFRYVEASSGTGVAPQIRTIGSFTSTNKMYYMYYNRSNK